MYFEDKGAYTGEISPLMLVDLCDFVILGHSERRQYFAETDEIINKKVKKALESGGKPILCVGETLEDNEAGRTEQKITRQVNAGLGGINPTSQLVIAYEPIWAIGTGRAATGKQANATISLIRSILTNIWNKETAKAVRILYGGSVTSSNIAEFIAEADIDGALVGGASLKANEFVSIVSQTATLKSPK
jgi:triosephosphate isomerase